MKLIKKSIILLITLSMMLIVIPYSSVFAKKGDVPSLRIAYDCQEVTYDKNIIIEYTYKDLTITESFKAYNFDYGGQIIDVGTIEKPLSQIQQDLIADFKNKVNITYDPNTICFTMEIKDGKTLNINSFKNDDISCFIYCYGNLKITGNGTINVKLINEPAEPQPPLAFGGSQTITPPVLIASKGTIEIGDDNSSLKMNIDAYRPELLPEDTDEVYGICAKEIKIKNTNLTINSKNGAFVVESQGSELSSEQDVLSIDKSTVIFNNKVLENDTDLRKCSLIDLSMIDDANVSVTNSTLKININDPSDNKTIVEEGPIINLSDTAKLNLEKSKLDYYSNANTLFCSTPVINIEDCSQVKCINDYYDCIFNVDFFDLKNSNFDIQSKGQTFIVYTKPDTFQGPFGKARQYSSSIIIVEEDSKYNGIMQINSDDLDIHIFPSPSSISPSLSSASVNPRDIPYEYIEISSKNDDLLKSISVGSASEFNNVNYTKNEEGLYIFTFIDGEDDPKKLDWRSFKLTHSPIPFNPSPRHEVINTGIN